MISAPSARSCRGGTPLTAPSVPTGMNAGVCTSPCGVRRMPVRAAPARAVTSNESGIRRAAALAAVADGDRLHRRARRQLEHEGVGGQVAVDPHLLEAVLGDVAVGLLVT